MRGLDRHAVRGGQDFHTSAREGSMVGYKWQVGGFKEGMDQAEKYIQSIVPNACISLPGLSLGNIWDYRVGKDHGTFSKKTLPQVMAACDHTVHAAIMGCNDEALWESCHSALHYARWVVSKYNQKCGKKGKKIEAPTKMDCPEDIFRFFLDMLQLLYQGSNCEVLFLATLFPRKTDKSKAHLKSAINNLICHSSGSRDFEMWITDREGQKRVLKWFPINLIPDVEAASPNVAARIHYCPFLADGVHIRPFYLERFLFILRGHVENLQRKSNKKLRRN